MLEKKGKHKIMLKSKSKHLLDNSPTTMPKSGEPWYCTKSVATPRGCPTLLYQPRVRTKLDVTILYTQQMHYVHVILFCFTKGCYFLNYDKKSKVNCWKEMTERKTELLKINDRNETNLICRKGNDCKETKLSFT